jgi:hypothetical protein
VLGFILAAPMRYVLGNGMRVSYHVDSGEGRDELHGSLDERLGHCMKWVLPVVISNQKHFVLVS